MQVFQQGAPLGAVLVLLPPAFVLPERCQRWPVFPVAADLRQKRLAGVSLLRAVVPQEVLQGVLPEILQPEFPQRPRVFPLRELLAVL